MSLKRFAKKASAVLACSSMALGGFMATGSSLMNVAFADARVESNGETGTITLTNHPANLVSYQIFNYNTTPVVYKGRTYRTGALMGILTIKNGTASISGLPYGLYRIKEYKTINGYSTTKTYYTVKLDEDVHDENLDPIDPIVGVVGAIRLTGNNGVSLKGMTFDVRNVGVSSVVYNGKVINVGELVCTITSPTDILTIPNLPYGVFEVTNTGAATGWHIDEDPKTVNIINNSTVPVTVYVTNHTHVWPEDGVITKHATCTEDGVMTWTCTVCGGTKTKLLPKLGHDYQTTKNPTCLEDGHKTCTRCGDVQMLKKHDHDWDDGVLQGSPTCEGNAVRIYTCKYCGEQRREVLPRNLGHTFVSTLVRATPNSPGHIEKVCEKCGYVDTTKGIASPERIVLAYDTTTYTGTAKRPAVVVKDTDGNTIASSQYTVTYTNNIRVGVANVRVQFKGNYSGVLMEQFEIQPKGTSIMSVTPLKNGFTLTWAVQSKETTGYEIEYATEPDFSDAAYLQTTNYTTLKKTVNWLPSKTKYYIRIRTYKGGSYSQWSQVKTVTTK